MFRANVLTLGLVILVPILVSGSEKRIVNFRDPLKVFLGSLERYANTQNDVVLLLDESGSISAETFPQVKLFAKRISQRFSVSADQTRVAVVTFADMPHIYLDYIADPYGKNMCRLMMAIDDIRYKEMWTDPDLEIAMLEAEGILKLSRFHANKIIVMLASGESNSGHRAIDVANRLKRDGVIIFAIGVANVNSEEINAVATAPDHTYILDEFDYIVQMNEYLVNDARDIKMDPARYSFYCHELCDEHASCYCGTRTGRYYCACEAGYQGKSGLKGHCHECPRGTYKSEALNEDCTPCPPHATTDKEASTSFYDCKWETGYEKTGNVFLHTNSYCLQNNKKYMNEETWISDCQNCVCDKGIVNCKDIMCNETECQLGENECYIFSEAYHNISVSRDSVAANSTAVLLSMCLLKLIIASIVSKLLL